MDNGHVISDEAAVEEEATERVDVIDEVAEREGSLRPSVEQSVQAKVDSVDDRAVEGGYFGLTLEEEERLQAREWEVERTRWRWDRHQGSDREARCRTVIEERNERRRNEFAARAGSVDQWQHPGEPDAREVLSRSELAAVNQEAARLSERLGGWSRAAVSRVVAERAVETGDVAGAVLSTLDELEVDPGCVVPIGRIGGVRGHEVSVEGVVRTLWEPSHPSIAQVGLLEDDTGRTKVTSWRKSEQPRFEEGAVIRIRDAAKSWYDGRWSIALTGRSRVTLL